MSALQSIYLHGGIEAEPEQPLTPNETALLKAVDIYDKQRWAKQAVTIAAEPWDRTFERRATWPSNSD